MVSQTNRIEIIGEQVSIYPSTFISYTIDGHQTIAAMGSKGCLKVRLTDRKLFFEEEFVHDDLNIVLASNAQICALANQLCKYVVRGNKLKERADDGRMRELADTSVYKFLMERRKARKLIKNTNYGSKENNSKEG